MDILKDLPGLPGIFIAGVFSAALSSLSTAMNSMAAVVLEDFYKPYTKKQLTERQTNYIMRGTVVVMGTIAVILGRHNIFWIIKQIFIIFYQFM